MSSDKLKSSGSGLFKLRRDPSKPILKPSTKRHVFYIAVAGFIVGLLFGVAMDKAKMNVPSVVQAQMQLDTFSLFKFFFAGTGLGAIVLSTFQYMGAYQRTATRSALGTKWLYGGNIIGGAMIGFSMALTGSCPGNMFAQFAIGLPGTVYVLLGGIVGAILFGYGMNFITRRNSKAFTLQASPYFDEALKLPFIPSSKTYLVTSMIIGPIMIAVAFWLENVSPWRKEVETSMGPYVINVLDQVTHKDPWSLDQPVWDPAVAGLLAGFLQVFAIILMETTLMASSAYCTIAAGTSLMIDINLEDNSPYLASFLTENQMFVMLFHGGIFLGALYSASHGNMLNYPLPPAAPFQQFLSGVFVIFGARLANGCTSGQGLSGVARLSVAAIVTSAAIFGGGIFFRFLFLALGVV